MWVHSLRALVGAVPRSIVRRQARRYLDACADCRTAQRAALHRLLALNADSRFSRSHGLDGSTDPAAFRRRLPIADYEFFRPWIEQVKEGDTAALLGRRNRLLMFALSSGTTAQSKFIPITRRFLDDYRRGWQVWGIRMLDDHKTLYGLDIVQLSSDYDRFRTPGGTPCGNISGLVAVMQKRIVQRMYTVPPVVAKIDDPEARHYTSLRLSLADPFVGMVMTANPSTLVHLARLAESRAEELIRDIAQGTLAVEEQLPPVVRRRLARRLRRRDPRRARQLERVAETTGGFRPADYWPRLALVAVWTGGSAGAYLHHLKRYYGETPVRDHGLSASEGRMTIPLADGTSDGILDVNSHYFEFIPEDEAESPRPTVLEAHELQVGRNYFILLTTASGLYRYNISDVVRCTGHHGTTPLLEFLHKGAHISSITGEKVSESQVVAAVRECIERMSIDVKHFTVCPVWGDPPGYQILIEHRDIRPPQHGPRLAAGVDRHLQQLNCEYREKRASGRLAEMTWLPLPDGTWSRFARESQQKLGGCAEQYKHPCLVPDFEFGERIVREHGGLSLPAARHSQPHPQPAPRRSA